MSSNQESLSRDERLLFEKYFEVAYETIGVDEFKRKRKALRAKYHPDRYVLHEAEVRKQAQEIYIIIDRLSVRAAQHILERSESSDTDESSEHVKSYASEGLYIEIITRDRDLKYEMFGTFMKWLEAGEYFTIPGTQAELFSTQRHRGSSMGFVETIKVYLRFSEKDSVADINDWLYSKIKDRASALLIAKERIAINRTEMERLIRRKTLIQIGNG